MATGIFAILDDIAALMDDVAVTSKVAASKTAGILGDDLAVNAEKATGFVSSREIPVLWAITKGSLLNKLIIVPIALLLNAFLPDVIKYVLILGGFYLAYEGVEKIIEFIIQRSKKNKNSSLVQALEDTNDSEIEEKIKINSAIKTDFILSIEIVIIALGTVLKESILVQSISVAFVALLASFGVYGIVALIVRMDDAGFKLIDKSNNKGIISKIGHLLVKALPIIIKAMGVIGTVALILVSGGIFDHNIEYFHHLFPQLPEMIKQIILGLVAGFLVFLLIEFFNKIKHLVKA